MNRVPAERFHQRAKCAACKAQLLPVANPIVIHDSEEFSQLLASSPFPVVVDFWATWCGPCRAVAPELEKLATAKAGHVIVAKVDTDALPEIGAYFKVQSIPTLVLFRQGKEAARISGAMPASAMASALGI